MSTEEEVIAAQMGDDDDGIDDAPDADIYLNTPEHHEGELVTPPPAALTQAEIEARQDKLDREAKRHADRVAEILGDDFAELIPNPCDWTPGYLINPALAPIPPEVLAAFDAIVGRGVQADYKEATDAQACGTCNALGRVLTGSRVEGQDTKPCSTCNGSGWTHKAAPLAPVPQLDFSQRVGGSAPMPPNAVQVADAYGRPAGHPHYGLNPATIGV